MPETSISVLETLSGLARVVSTGLQPTARDEIYLFPNSEILALLLRCSMSAGLVVFVFIGIVVSIIAALVLWPDEREL